MPHVIPTPSARQQTLNSSPFCLKASLIALHLTGVKHKSDSPDLNASGRVNVRAALHFMKRSVKTAGIALHISARAALLHLHTQAWLTNMLGLRTTPGGVTPQRHGRR